MNILVALDGSRLAEASLGWLPLLEPLKIESITLVSVVEDFEEGVEVRGGDEFFERQSVLYSAYLADVAKRLRQKLTCPISTELACGVPDQELQKMAKAKKADLLVLTTHGRSGLTRWAIGSVADKVVRRVDRPTLVIGPEAVKRGPRKPISTILVPLDGSALGEAGLGLAGNWAKALSAELHAVRVVNFPVMTAEDVLVSYSPDIMESLQQAATHYLAQVAGRTGVQPSKTVVLTGPPAEELIRYCVENDIDLVVMSSHGRRGMIRAVLGSTTDRMLHAPAPVLIVPSC